MSYLYICCFAILRFLFRNSARTLVPCVADSMNTSTMQTFGNEWTHVRITKVISKVKVKIVVEVDPKAPFSIVITPKCRRGRLSITWIAPFYLWFFSYLIMLNIKQGGIKSHFWVFVITRPGMKSRPPAPLANTLLIRQMTLSNINHHHHIVLAARISLTFSRHPSLSFIALGRSSGQHPVSSHSCWMYVRAGRPAFARPCVGIHKSTSLMSSSLLLQQCPACLVRLTWIDFVIGGRWPYSWCLVGCRCQAQQVCQI